VLVEDVRGHVGSHVVRRHFGGRELEQCMSEWQGRIRGEISRFIYEEGRESPRSGLGAMMAEKHMTIVKSEKVAKKLTSKGFDGDVV